MRDAEALASEMEGRCGQISVGIGYYSDAFLVAALAIALARRMSHSHQNHDSAREFVAMLARSGDFLALIDEVAK